MNRTAFTVFIFTLALYFCFPASSFTQVFWSEDFSAGIPPGWLTVDHSAQNINWAYCASPESCLPVEPLFGCGNNVIETFYAPTADNGFAILRSSFLPQPHQSIMTTGVIDCSDYDQVFMQFHTSIGSCDEPAMAGAKIKVETSDGVHTFIPFPALDAAAPQRAPLRYLVGEHSFVVTLDLTEVAAGREFVMLKWEWEANGELAWLVDDISLSAAHPAAPPNAIYYEPFAFGSGNWISAPLTGSDADANWEWVDGGSLSSAFSVKQNDAFGPYLFMHSATAVDGAMVFNADFYSTGGISPPSQQIFYLCDLISPAIDLSDVQQPVALRLTHLASLGNTAPDAPSTTEGARFLLSYAYSIDGGDSWSDPLPVNPYLTPVTSVNFERLPPHFLSEYFTLPGAEGHEDVRIKFTWAGDLFFWAIDDISIVTRPAFDLRTNDNFFARLPNVVTPASQLTAVPLLADVENIGALPVTGIQQTFSVTAGDQTLYADEQPLGSLAVDSLFENRVFPDFFPADMLTAPGTYQAAYDLSGEGLLQQPADDRQAWPLRVSDTLFAKENGFTRDVAPIGGINYAYGNCFYVPNGDGQYARTLSFAVGNAGQLSDFNRFVNTFLYQWDGDLNENGKADGEELTELAFNFYPFEGNEGVRQITIPVSNDGLGVPLQDSTYYLAIVSYGALQPPAMFMLVSDTIDYQATYLAHEQAGLPKRYGGMLQVGSDGELSFETVGFGLNIVPTVRLSISPSPILSSRQQLLPDNSLRLSPNPATDQVQIAIDLPPEHQQRQLRLYTPQGKLLVNRTIPDGETTSLLSVAGLPSGLYTVRLSTKMGSRSVKLVVQE